MSFFLQTRFLLTSLLTVTLMFGLSWDVLAQKVPKEKTDSVRVKLFDTENPGAITLTAFIEPFTLQLDTKYRLTVDTESSVTILYTRGNFAVTYLNKQWKTSTIRITSTPKGLIRVKLNTFYPRYYHGKLEFSTKHKLHPINTIALEDYVASVVGSEMNFLHPEALKVQAVISRTYALWNVGTLGKTDFDLTDHTLSQVYLGEFIEKPWFRQAAEATKGEIAVFGDKLILAVFSSTCGGHTCDNESVWSGKPLPYLRGQSDHDACLGSPHFSWTFSIEQTKWKNWIKKEYPKADGNFMIREFTNDNRAKTIGFSFDDTKYKANEFRLKMIQSFGARSLKSLRFSFVQREDSVVFVGNGMGHGVGLCQWGALGFAEAGWKYHDILRFYYQGIEIKPVYFDSEKNYLELAQ